MTRRMRVSVVVKRGERKVEERDGTVVVHTTEKRENNRANIDVIKQLSRHYSIPPSAIRIIAGANSTKKVVEISKAYGRK